MIISLFVIQLAKSFNFDPIGIGFETKNLLGIPNSHSCSIKKGKTTAVNERATDKAHMREIVRKANKVVRCVEEIGERKWGGE
jgi:hypothetical protein